MQRLQSKEKEVEKLKLNLREDQNIVLAQKTELNQLKGELIREFDTAPDDSELGEQQAKLLDKLKDIECIEEQLNERDSHLTDAENMLLKRLQEISEREAQLEQQEVDAGLRKV